MNKDIVNLFSKSKFDEEAIYIFEQISEMIFDSRKNESIKKTKLVSQNIQELESKKRHISENIQNLLSYPELLESQNEELQRIKEEMNKLHIQKMKV